MGPLVHLFIHFIYSSYRLGIRVDLATHSVTGKKDLTPVPYRIHIAFIVGCQVDVQLMKGEGGVDGVTGFDTVFPSAAPYRADTKSTPC